MSSGRQKMLEELKKEVCEANLELVRRGVVIYTWGNVSGISEDRKYMVIKPSGVDYDGMSADEEVDLAPLKTLFDLSFCRRLDRTREQFHADAQTLKHLCDVEVMLGGQNFGRCHHAGLEAVVDGYQHAKQRHQRFATAHVALQQPVHLMAALHVIANLFHHPFLRIGQRKGEPFVIESVEKIAHHWKKVSVRTPLTVVFGILVVQLKEE